MNIAHNSSNNLRYYIENNRKEWGNDDDEAGLGVSGSQILLVDLDVGYSSP